jgi:hypothetical protein
VKTNANTPLLLFYNEIKENSFLRDPEIKLNSDSNMKKLLLLALMGLISSCSTAKKSSSLLQEEQFYITRKYIGDFIDYRHTGPQIVGGNDLIWITTTIYSTYGKISAYSKTCDFSPGDRIYLKPINSIPGYFGYWDYQIENDSSVSYKVSEYRYENNVFMRIRSL